MEKNQNCFPYKVKVQRTTKAPFQSEAVYAMRSIDGGWWGKGTAFQSRVKKLWRESQTLIFPATNTIVPCKVYEQVVLLCCATFKYTKGLQFRRCVKKMFSYLFLIVSIKKIHQFRNNNALFRHSSQHSRDALQSHPQPNNRYKKMRQFANRSPPSPNNKPRRLRKSSPINSKPSKIRARRK